MLNRDKKKTIRDRSNIQGVWIWSGIFLISCVLAVAYYLSSAENEPQTPISSIDRDCYSLVYDSRTRNPVWVLETIWPQREKLISPSSPVEYSPDPDLPIMGQAKIADYKNSGFEISPLLMFPRGLLDEYTPYISTTSPQLPEFKNGVWKNLENYIHSLVQQSEAERILIISGPLFLPQEGPNKKKYVTYEVIGDGKIAVPTHFFRAIFYPTWGEDNGKLKIESEYFIIPNQKLKEDISLDTFKVEREVLENTSCVSLPKNIRPYLFVSVPRKI